MGTGTWGQYPQVIRLENDILVRGYFDPFGSAANDDVALISRTTGMVQLLAGAPGSDSAGDFPVFTVDETGFFGGIDGPVDATAIAVVEGASGLDGLAILGASNGLVLSGQAGLTASKYSLTRHPTLNVESASLVSVGHGTGSLGNNVEDVLVFSDLSGMGQTAEAGVQVQQTVDRSRASLLSFSDSFAAGLVDPQPVDLGDDGTYFMALIPQGDGTHAFGLFQVRGVDPGDPVELVFAIDLGTAAERLLFSPLASGPAYHYAVIAFAPGESIQPVVVFNATKVIDQAALTLDGGLVAESLEIIPDPDPSREPQLLAIDVAGEAFLLEWNQGTGTSVSASLGFSSYGTWAGALVDPVNGGFSLIIEKSGEVAGLQSVALGGSGYVLTSTGSVSIRRPALTPGSAFSSIQAVAYDARPFVDVGAMPVEVYQAGDWGSSPSVPSGTTLSIDAESFDGATSGLDNPGSSVVGVLPGGASVADVATNQWDPTVSLWFGRTSGASLSPTVSIFPDAVNVQSLAFTPEVSALPGGTIYYRYGGSGVYQPDSDGILPAIVEDTVVEVFAEHPTTGAAGPLLRVSYAFADTANERDSDGDGLPDALEHAIGSDPVDNDCDGDTIPDAAELYLDMADGSFNDDINTSDSAAFSAEDIAAAREALGRGRASFDLTLIGQRVLDGYDAGIDGFSEQDIAVLASEETPPAGGLLLLQDATGAILAEGSDTLRGPLFVTPAVDMPAPNQFLTISTGQTYDPAPWDRIFGGEPMRSDFNTSTEGWYQQRGLSSIITRLYRGPGQYAGASKPSSKAEIWNGGEWAVNFAGSGLDEIHGIRAEVSLRSGSAPAYLHLVLERENTGTTVTTSWVSEGKRLEAISPDWQEVRFILDEANFSKTPSGSETFDTVLQVETGGSLIKRVGFVLSETPEVAIDGGGLPEGTSTLPGFYIDRIRPIGLPGSGQRIMATVPTPDIELAVVPFDQAGATLEDRLDAWLADYESARAAISGGSVEVSVRSTVVSLLFEQVLNQTASTQLATLADYDGAFRTVAPALLPSEIGSFAVADPTTGEPTVDSALSGFSLAELEFLRYPSLTESLASSALTGAALDPHAVLSDLDALVQGSFDPAGLDALAQVALGVYQVAGSFSSTNPGSLGSPIQVLRAILTSGYAGLPDPIMDDLGTTEVAFRWKAVLSKVLTDPGSALSALAQVEAKLDAARDIAAGYLGTPSSRTLRAATVTVGSGLEDLTDAGAFTYELVDRDGNPFPLPEDFYFPTGSELSISGFERSQSGSHFVLEVTEMQVLSIPRTTPTDSDGNLIDDVWELAFLGEVGVDAYADPDGDGLNNLTEFIGGTDPSRQPTSYNGGTIPNPLNWPVPLRIERQSSGDFWVILPMPSDQAEEFNWVVEVSNDLESFAIETEIVESNGTSEQVFIIEAAAFTKAFWRIKAELQ